MQRLILGTLILSHAAHITYYPHLAFFFEKGTGKVEAFLCSSGNQIAQDTNHKTLQKWTKKWKILAYINGFLYVSFFFTPFPNPNSLSLWSVVLLIQVEGLQGKGEVLEMVQCHMKLWKYIFRNSISFFKWMWQSFFFLSTKVIIIES